MAARGIKVKSTFVSDGPGNGYRARVPVEVRERLGARVGDELVFEEGCEQAVMRAALLGPYFVVRLERAAPAQVAVSTAASQPLESLAEAVRKKQEEAGKK